MYGVDEHECCTFSVTIHASNCLDTASGGTSWEEHALADSWEAF